MPFRARVDLFDDRSDYCTLAEEGYITAVVGGKPERAVRERDDVVINLSRVNHIDEQAVMSLGLGKIALVILARGKECTNCVGRRGRVAYVLGSCYFRSTGIIKN